MIEAFKTHINYITMRGFRPSFNIIDNVASKAIIFYSQEKNIRMQLFEPHTHQVNASEREIQSFKNNFFVGLSLGDKPLHPIPRLTQSPLDIKTQPTALCIPGIGRDT